MTGTNTAGDLPVILFDGECPLCSRAVWFVLRRDRGGRFRFCALQSAAGRALLGGRGLDATGVDTVVLLEGGRAYLCSDAALRVVAGLGWPWRGLGALRVIPRRWRDGAYRWVARRRHRWFGGRTACFVPPESLRDRFIDGGG